MTVKVSIHNYDVYDSGVIVLPENEYVEFNIESLRYRVSFSDDLNGENLGKTRVTGALDEEDGKKFYSLKVINYNSLFNTPQQLFEMGTLRGRKLFLYFSVVPISDDKSIKSRVFHYTWYISKEISNGTSTEQH